MNGSHIDPWVLGSLLLNLSDDGGSLRHVIRATNLGDNNYTVRHTLELGL